MNFKTFLKSLWGKRFELDGPKSALRYFYPDLWEKELNSPEIAARVILEEIGSLLDNECKWPLSVRNEEILEMIVFGDKASFSLSKE